MAELFRRPGIGANFCRGFRVFFLGARQARATAWRVLFSFAALFFRALRFFFALFRLVLFKQFFFFAAPPRILRFPDQRLRTRLEFAARLRRCFPSAEIPFRARCSDFLFFLGRRLPRRFLGPTPHLGSRALAGDFFIGRPFPAAGSGPTRLGRRPRAPPVRHPGRGFPRPVDFPARSVFFFNLGRY